MREIQFRGKTVETGNWVYGSYQADVMLEDKHTIIYSDYDGFYCEDEITPESVGQYTGLKDKNGREIYEGDIVNVNKYGGTPAYKKVSYWIRAGRIGIMPFIDDGHHWGAHECEVVGNIHENPELLGDSNS